MTARRARCPASSRSSRTRIGPHVAWFDLSYDDKVARPARPFRAALRRQDHFSGQPVALVVAETLEAARYAAALVGVEYERAEHNTDIQSRSPSSTSRSESAPASTAAEAPRRCASGLHAAAGAGRRGDYHLPTEHHNPMEMHATTVVWEGDGKITVYDKTQGSQNVQDYLASVFGFAKKNVRVAQPVRRRRIRLGPSPAVSGLSGRAGSQEARALGARRADAPADVQPRAPAGSDPDRVARRRRRRQAGGDRRRRHRR